MVHSDIFAITFAILTIYTLFAPNVLLIFGLSTEYTASVAIINTIVLCFFALECDLADISVIDDLFGGWNLWLGCLVETSVIQGMHSFLRLYFIWVKYVQYIAQLCSTWLNPSPLFLLLLHLSRAFGSLLFVLKKPIHSSRFIPSWGILSCIFVKGYMRSGRVFLDIMAMVSLAGDTLVWVHLFPSGFPTATVVDFRDDATGFTGRSDRLLDILKFARLFRIVQWPGDVTT